MRRQTRGAGRELKWRRAPSFGSTRIPLSSEWQVSRPAAGELDAQDIIAGRRRNGADRVPARDGAGRGRHREPRLGLRARTPTAGCGAPTAPCRSLQYVHNIIAAGGEIDVLDPAGYGAVTITHALSIVNDGVGTAGVQGAGGVAINAGPSDAVTLRGLNIDGLGTGPNGIVFNSGHSLTVVNCVARRFVTDGVRMVSSAGSMNFLIANVIATDNRDGRRPFAASGTANVNGVIDDVVATNNAYGIVASGFATGGASTIAITNDLASRSADGVYPQWRRRLGHGVDRQLGRQR